MTSTDILEYFDKNADLVENHPGAAYPEVSILRRLVKSTPSGPAGILGDVYLESVNRRISEVKNRGDVYGLTHEIFFATDFGRINAALPNLSDLLNKLLPQYHDDPDPLGELLMVAKIVGHSSDVVTAARTVFDKAVASTDTSKAGFNDNYHLLLVAGLLGHWD